MAYIRKVYFGYYESGGLFRLGGTVSWQPLQFRGRIPDGMNG